MKYVVRIREIVTKDVLVFAESEEEAEQKIRSGEYEIIEEVDTELQFIGEISED